MWKWAVFGALVVAVALVAWLILDDESTSRSTRRSLPEGRDGAGAQSGEATATPNKGSGAASTGRAATLVTLPDPVDLEKVDRDRDLHGIVVAKEGGAPVAGAKLQVVTYPWRRTSVLNYEQYGDTVDGPLTLSARDGTFALRLAEGSAVALRVSAEGFAPLEVVHRQAGERLRVEMAPGVSLIVVAIDDQGHPAADADMRLFRSDYKGDYAFEVRPDRIESHRYVFLSLPAGAACNLDAVHPRLGRSGWTTIALPDEGELTHELMFPTGRTLTGRVIDAESGAAVANARVGMNWVLRPEVRTDETGRYELSGWTGKGVRDVHVIADGYGRAEKRVGNADVVDFDLHPGDSVTGRVLGHDRNPVARAYVTALGSKQVDGEQNICNRSGRTDAEGRFLLSGLRRDMLHALVVTAKGHARYLLDFAPHPSRPGTVDLGEIVLPRSATIQGRVLTADGQPAARTKVVLIGHNSDRGRLLGRKSTEGSHYGNSEERHTDDLGRFRFRDQPPGKFTVRVRPDGATRIERTVELPPGHEHVEVEIRLHGGKEFSVTLVDEEGAPVPGAFLYAQSGNESLNGQSDARGRATFTVTTQVKSVSVFVPDGGFSQQDYEVPDGSFDVRIVMRRASPISGRILDEEGKPIDKAWIGANRDGEQIASSRSNSDGRFKLDVPPGGPCDIRLMGISNAGGVMDESRYEARIDSVVPGTENIELRATRTRSDRTLRVRVLMPDGSPATSAWAFAGQQRVKVEETGRATLSSLPAREIQVGAFLPPPHNEGYAPPLSAKVIPEGQEIVLRFRIASHIKGVVITPPNTKIRSTWIRLERGEEHIAVTSRAPDGSFKLTVAEDEEGPLVLKATAHLEDGRRLHGVKEGVRPGEAGIELKLE